MEAKPTKKSCPAILRIDANSFCRFVDQNKRKLIDEDGDEKSDSDYETVDQNLIDEIENITLEINENFNMTVTEKDDAVGSENKGQKASRDKNCIVLSVIHSALNSYVESSVADLLLQLLRGEKYHNLPELVETVLELPIEVHGEGFIKVTNLLLKVTLVQPHRMLRFWIEVNRQRNKFISATQLLNDLVLSLQRIVQRKTYDDLLERDAQSEFEITHELPTEVKWRAFYQSNHARAEKVALLISQLFRQQVVRCSKVMELMMHLSSAVPTEDIVSMHLLVAIMTEIGDEFECTVLNDCKTYSHLHEKEKGYKSMLDIYKKLTLVENYSGYKTKEGYWLKVRSKVIISKKHSLIAYLKQEIKCCMENPKYTSSVSSEEANSCRSRSYHTPLTPVAPTGILKIETSTAQGLKTVHGGSKYISPSLLRRIKERLPDLEPFHPTQSQSGQQLATSSRMVDKEEARTKL